MRVTHSALAARLGMLVANAPTFSEVIDKIDLISAVVDEVAVELIAQWKVQREKNRYFNFNSLQEHAAAIIVESFRHDGCATASRVVLLAAEKENQLNPGLADLHDFKIDGNDNKLTLTGEVVYDGGRVLQKICVAASDRLAHDLYELLNTNYLNGVRKSLVESPKRGRPKKTK